MCEDEIQNVSVNYLTQTSESHVTCTVRRKLSLIDVTVLKVDIPFPVPFGHLNNGVIFR